VLPAAWGEVVRAAYVLQVSVVVSAGRTKKRLDWCSVVRCGTVPQACRHRRRRGAGLGLLPDWPIEHVLGTCSDQACCELDGRQGEAPTMPTARPREAAASGDPDERVR
jgi:hypothetical protein